MSDQLPQQTTVLIVGAGPTGLATAVSLVHHGIRDFVIVDAVVEGQNTSRAIAVHAATLEALDTIDCASDLIARGFKGKRAKISSRTSSLMSADFAYLSRYTQFPFVLTIPQTITEQVLANKLASLNARVYRPHIVTGLTPNKSDDKFTDVTFSDGQVVSAKYVIAADGARSAVRSSVGVSFKDPDGETLDTSNVLSQLVLADVIFKDPSLVPDRESVNGILCPEGFFLIIPIPLASGDLPEHTGGLEPHNRGDVFRIGGGIPPSLGTPPSSPSLDYVQSLLDAFGPISPSGKLEIESVLWSTRFRTHSAIADRFFVRFNDGEEGKVGGAIFLVGDAAHIHSPAGGQGMNLGLRDAVGLGEVLSQHISQSESNDTILMQFAEARHARALQVIAFTKTLLSTFEPRWPWPLRWLGWMGISRASVRDIVVRILGKVAWIRGMGAWRVSGLGMR